MPPFPNQWMGSQNDEEKPLKISVFSLREPLIMINLLLPRRRESSGVKGFRIRAFLPTAGRRRNDIYKVAQIYNIGQLLQFNLSPFSCQF